MGTNRGERRRGKRIRAAAYWHYYQDLYAPGNDCSLCKNSSDLRKAWGCDGPSQSGPWGDRFLYRFGDYVTDRCPLRIMKSAWLQKALTLYGAYKNGITPNGVWNKETAHYQATMVAIEVTQSEAANWYHAEAERRRKK